ncbi:MAG: PD-(D/E)XK nuclease family transposase [Clostridia bacterium]|nr:PD-(D/E)XK nuclease family transposase [Clostridia bacterium]
MDDTFMTRVFTDNPLCTQFVLRIIMDKPDLIVTEVRAQKDMRNLYGRSVRLDVFATDNEGKIYNIEVQRRDSGAIPRRARYNSSMIDANVTEPGEKFEQLAETYVIFIMEHDIFHRGLPEYHIERYISETLEPFGDDAHIIYVNGEIRGDTPLGFLMHDFFCSEPKQMKYAELAEHTRPYKEITKGDGKMCRIMQELIDEEVVWELKESHLEIAEEMLNDGIYPKEKIAQLTHLTLAEVEQLAASLGR